MAPEIPEAASLAYYMQNSIAENRVVTLSSMDEPNLVPMFNSYAWGASLSQDDRNEIDKLNPEPLPFEREHPFRKVSLKLDL